MIGSMKVSSLRSGLSALLMLVGLLVGSNLEPIVGALRDGVVHHESLVAAGAHQATTPGGEHGHEDGLLAGGRPSHGPGHQHGTAVDHCTHAHGVGAPSSVSVEFAGAVVTVAPEPPAPVTSRLILTLSPPPKA